jgi:hypothetical protein
MSPASDAGRLDRSLAAVEARYLRDLGRRARAQPSSSARSVRSASSISARSSSERSG